MFLFKSSETGEFQCRHDTMRLLCLDSVTAKRGAPRGDWTCAEVLTAAPPLDQGNGRGPWYRDPPVSRRGQTPVGLVEIEAGPAGPPNRRVVQPNGVTFSVMDPPRGFVLSARGGP